MRAMGMTVGVVLGVLCLVLAGCGSGSSAMGQYDIEVSLAPELVAAPPTLTVDVVGTSEANAQDLAAKDAKVWFSGGDAHRAAATKLTTEFGAGNTSTKVLKRNDKGVNEATWKAWRDSKVTRLFVLVNLPRDGSVRKIELPLDRNRWKQDTIRVEIGAGGIRSTNGPEPEPAK